MEFRHAYRFKAKDYSDTMIYLVVGGGEDKAYLNNVEEKFIISGFINNKFICTSFLEKSNEIIIKE